ncbi:MAG TPA: hypothetical protein VH277_10715, partial [Gemmatimonadaceae bacterium]|nr:hypothetical protein [Gemmatimonadaceae bacterium]
MRPACALILASASIVVHAAHANAQRNRGFGGEFGCADLPSHAVPYDGHFTFARLRYKGGPGNCYYRG